ncbi:MAG: hypothetical protein WCR21_02635, partial [Bacteroidota bacterium]
MQKLILLFIGLLFLTCSVQKRRYQQGYHIGRSYHKAISKKSVKHPSAIGKNNLYPENDFVQVNTNDDGLVQSKKALQQNTNKVDFVKDAQLPNDTCDVLIFKDGSEIQGKVIEISPGQIKYKRCDLLNGPLYTVKKSEVFMVKYSNGVREVIKEEGAPPQSVSPNQVPPNYQIPNKNNINQVDTRNQKMHPSAVWAFAWGLLSLLCLLLASGSAVLIMVLVSFTAAIRAISASIKAIRQINNYPTDFKGKGLAMTGRVFGIVVLS